MKIITSTKNVNTASLFAQLAVASIQQIFGSGSLARDSPQHEAHEKNNVGYGIDAFYDH